MADTQAPEVTRTVDLDATVDEVWTALTDDQERAAWFGGDGQIDIRPGGVGEVAGPDGSVQRIEVDTVEPGRRLGWRWSPKSGGAASDVEFVLDPLPRGARLTVTERRVAGTGPQASIAPAVTDRLLDLELWFLSATTKLLARSWV
jgi:uncharacterized protein YndB with AHSA1/START domain